MNDMGILDTIFPINQVVDHIDNKTDKMTNLVIQGDPKYAEKRGSAISKIVDLSGREQQKVNFKEINNNLLIIGLVIFISFFITFIVYVSHQRKVNKNKFFKHNQPEDVYEMKEMKVQDTMETMNKRSYVSLDKKDHSYGAANPSFNAVSS